LRRSRETNRAGISGCEQRHDLLGVQLDRASLSLLLGVTFSLAHDWDGKKMVLLFCLYDTSCFCVV
jgi:hypothetical protein